MQMKSICTSSSYVELLGTIIIIKNNRDILNLGIPLLFIMDIPIDITGLLICFFLEHTPEKLNSGKSHDTPYSNAI